MGSFGYWVFVLTRKKEEFISEKKLQEINVVKEATDEPLDYGILAFTILSYCSVTCAFDYPDRVHIKLLIDALNEINDKKFVEALSKVETADDYLKLEIPDNEVLRYYIIDGQNNIANELGLID